MQGKCMEAFKQDHNLHTLSYSLFFLDSADNALLLPSKSFFSRGMSLDFHGINKQPKII